ncbi:hypothetical protein [Embleya sp. AB8]|uniref:hypothetical protein n=1 Tax=Embleya sp. AB8 TaxID=3156304 RepID=UPI003C764C72
MRSIPTTSSRRARIAITIAVIGLGATSTACQFSTGDGDKAGKTASNGIAPAAPAAPAADPTQTAPPAAPQQTAEAPSAPAKTGGNANTSGTGGSGDSGGDKKGYGQVCSATDLTFKTSLQTQAGGYILIAATVKSGITCAMPGALPTVTFGSKGIQASNAEQVAGEQITLSGGATIYAGVNPKTTNNESGTHFTSMGVGVGRSDPNPASLTVADVTVDKPIVTNWHTKAADAVPGDGTDG